MIEVVSVDDYIAKAGRVPRKTDRVPTRSEFDSTGPDSGWQSIGWPEAPIDSIGLR